MGAWTALGPAPIGPPYLAGGGGVGGANSGRVTAVTAIPSGSHSGRVVIGAAGGGIWTSDDNGATWTPRTDSQADLAIGSLAVDPSNPDHLIAGTGEQDHCGDCYAGDGILVSTDGGATWTLQNPGGVFTGLDVGQVAIDPSDANHQFAATSSPVNAAAHGLYVTTDGGTTWAKPTDSSYTAVDGNMDAVVIDSHNNVYIGGGAATVAKSTDGGTTWAAANTNITLPSASTLPLIALAIAASTPSTLYVSVGSTNAVGLYKTTDSAGTWSAVSAAPNYTGVLFSYNSGSGSQGWFDNVLAVDPSNPNHVLAGGITLVESTNGGSSWTNVNGQKFFDAGANNLHPDQHALAFSSGTVWIGDDGGLFRYTPSTSSVTAANGNLNITQFYFGFSVAGGQLLAGSQDNASAQTSSFAGAAPWTGVFVGDGGPSAITSNSTSTEFIEADGGLYYTTNGFATVSPSSIAPTASAAFTPPMIVVPNPATPSNPTVYFGAQDLYQTTNPTSGHSWTKVTSHGSGCSSGGTCVTAIAASADGTYVYVGFTDGTLEVSTNSGASFTALASETRTESYVTGISVDPSNPQAITASFSYNDTRYHGGDAHVEQYDWTATAADSGIWTTISGSGLPAAVSRVIYDRGSLIAGTDAGVYATSAPNGSSTTWSQVGSGLPNVQVQDLYADSTGLYVVTHGRGAWLLPNPPVNSSAPAISGQAVEAQMLTEVHGAWQNNPASYSYQWQRCDNTGSGCVDIAGATSPTYVPTSNDLGHTIVVEESATNGGGTAGPVASAPTAVVTPPPPVNATPPAISGDTTQGQTLSESHGSWSNSPSSFAYQWQDCDGSGANCAPILGATGQAYALAASDVGHTIRVQESAANAGGAAGPASSAATAVVRGLSAPLTKPQNTSPPAVSGAARVGGALSASQGAWSGSAPLTFSYRWQRCTPTCSDIPGASAETYTLTASDLNANVRVLVTATNSAGSAQAASAAAGPVAPSAAQIAAVLLAQLAPSGKGAKIGALLKARGYAFSFRTLGAGRVVIDWFYLAPGARLSRAKAKPVLLAAGGASFSTIGAAPMTIKLTARGKQLLKRSKRLELTAKGTYSLAGSPVTVATKSFGLKR